MKKEQILISIPYERSKFEELFYQYEGNKLIIGDNSQVKKQLHIIDSIVGEKFVRLFIISESELLLPEVISNDKYIGVGNNCQIDIITNKNHFSVDSESCFFEFVFIKEFDLVIGVFETQLFILNNDGIVKQEIFCNGIIYNLTVSGEYLDVITDVGKEKHFLRN